MPAKSTKQQRLMGMVHATQTGKIKAPSEKVAKLAKSMTKKSAKDYASTKHKDIPKKAKEKIVKENYEYENKVGQLHVVQKPYNGCDLSTLVYEIDPITGIQPHGIDAQTVHGVYPTSEEAQKVAEKAYNDHMDVIKKLEEKKGTVANKLTSAITKLEKKHKEHMEMAKSDPKNADEHKKHVEEIQEKIKSLMDKLALVEKSKKPVKDDKAKKDLKESEDGDIDTLKNLLDTHDWFYTFSEDPKVYSKGTQEINLIRSLAKKLGDQGIKMYVDKFKQNFPSANADELTNLMKRK